MRRALVLAANPTVRPGPNPRVGCVVLSPSGSVVAQGYHRGAGTAHAEVDALRAAGAAARGATAVVSLEPCRHTGRTGPCTRALVEAGVARVVYAQQEPTGAAGGGADELRAAGVDVVGGLLAAEATELNHAWTFAVTHGRPHVTWKYAATLDGRVAASDGSSRWVTGAAARQDVHSLRRQSDVVLAGTGTVLADDSHLAVRNSDGRVLPTAHQPLRAVMGYRELPAGARVLDTAAPTRRLVTHEPAEALSALWQDGARRVLLEGGPTLAGVFVAAGLVDRVVGYLAPTLLGSGSSALGPAGVRTIDGAVRLRIDDVTRVGDDVRLTADVVRAAPTEGDH